MPPQGYSLLQTFITSILATGVRFLSVGAYCESNSAVDFETAVLVDKHTHTLFFYKIYL